MRLLKTPNGYFATYREPRAWSNKGSNKGSEVPPAVVSAAPPFLELEITEFAKRA